ncbi:MAG TPA: hypothetical protein VF526_16580 [Solirubrobacteraceae bacterium]
MLIVLAALSDLLIAVIAVIALLLGLFLIARGAHREPAKAPDDASVSAPLRVPVAAVPAKDARTPAPRPTTFRQGAIKLEDAPFKHGSIRFRK